MGNYISTQELTERVGTAQMNKALAALGYTVNSQAAVNFQENLISRAENLVNSYMGSIYEVALPKSPMVQEWAMRFAEYEFYKHGGGGDVPVKWKDSYNEALAQIKDALRGLIRIPGNLLRNPTVGDSMEIRSERAYFTPKKCNGMRNADLF